MKAIVVHQEAHGPRLQWADVPDVEFGADEVLIEVRASAVNRADLSQARGNYPPPPGVSDILGLEASGVIIAAGEQVTDWRVGDRVCCLLPGGGYAQRVAVPAGMLLPLPPDWSFAQGAAVPEVWLTAFVNLFLEGNLQASETVLIHAAGSGVGTAAIQLAVITGATVFATAGTEAKLRTARELGATLAINYQDGDFVQEVQAFSDGAGVDLILDAVGASHVPGGLELLREQGRLMLIGLLSGARTEINLGYVLGKSLRIIGSRLRPRPVAEKIAITRAFAEGFWPMFQDGTLKPVIDRLFPMPLAQEAHDYVLQNQNTGKVILTLPQGE